LKLARKNINNLKIISLCLLSLIFLHIPSYSLSKAFDGIWFMGFNLKHDLLKDSSVRQAIYQSIDRKDIATNIMSKEVVPVGFVPPGMLGYDPDLVPRKYNLKYAKLLMKQAGYPMADQRLKDLSLLHTDGVKTIAIAQKIQSDLENIGIKVNLVEVSYEAETAWIKELTSGKHDFYLLGYKAGYEELFKEGEDKKTIDSFSLLEPLFKTNGETNFSGYSNEAVDELLYKVSGLDLALKSERHAKLKEINDILYQDLPAVVLFYIEKL